MRTFNRKNGWSVGLLVSALAFVVSACGATDDGPTDEPTLGEVSQALSVPNGFFSISSGTGVTVYQKNYAGGQPDYVTVVDLRQGSLKNLNGTPSGNAGAQLIARKSMSTFWSDAVAGNTGTKTAKVVVNGTFFSTNQSPTPIAYGLKAGGTVFNYGYASGDYPGFLRVFQFNSSGQTCAILNYDKPNFPTTFNSNTPDAAGTVDPGANFAGQQSSWIARTLVGVADQNGDGVPETALFYSSALATQASAKAVLNAFGAPTVALFDSGGSTGAIVDGVTKVTAGRTVPHAIAIYAGK